MVEARTRAQNTAIDAGDEPLSLTVDLDAWPLSMDPCHIVDFNQALVLDTLVDPLLREDPHNAHNVLPSALRIPECLDDGHTWRLRTTPGQTWTDGTAVRPEDIAAGIHRAWGPTCLPLPPGYAVAMSGSPVTTHVVADGPEDATIEVRSTIPLPYLPQLLAFTGAAPFREVGDGWRASGPCRPVRVDRGKGRIELHRAPSRRTGSGTPDRVVFQVHAERADALAAFDAGLVDLSLNTGLNAEDFARLADLPHATVRALSLACQLWIRPGIDSVLTTAAGRHAFSAGFDREAVATRLHGAVLPLHSYSELWEPRRTGADVTERITQSDGTAHLGAESESPTVAHAQAQRLPPRHRRAELTLTYADFPPNDAVVAALAADLEDRFGHPVRPRPLAYAAFAQAVTSLDYELLYCINPAPLAHPAGHLTQFHGDTATGRALGLQDDVLDAALDRALRTAGANASAWAWREAEMTVLERAPVVPLFQVNSITLHRSGLAPPAVAACGAINIDDVFRPAVPDSRDRRAVTA